MKKILWLGGQKITQRHLDMVGNTTDREFIGQPAFYVRTTNIYLVTSPVETAMKYYNEYVADGHTPPVILNRVVGGI